MDDRRTPEVAQEETEGVRERRKVRGVQKTQKLIQREEEDGDEEKKREDFESSEELNITFRKLMMNMFLQSKQLILLHLILPQ